MKQLKTRRNFCGLHSLGGRLEGPNGTTYRTTRLLCKSWSCPQCAAKRARKLKKAIVEQSRTHGLDRFLTLTMDPSKGTAEESWPQIKIVWKKFQTYLTRKQGKGFKFLWVIEAQKNGYAHLHILLNQYLDQAWIKKVWDRLGGGRIVFITRANVAQAGPYLAKYLSKGFDGGLKPGQRRYGSSRSVNLGASGAKTGKWVCWKLSLELLYARAQGTLVKEWRNFEGLLDGFDSASPPAFIPQ
jgi:hypothetical protein